MNTTHSEEIHSIPCEVSFRGKTDVSENFIPAKQEGSCDDAASSLLEVRLRGRLLKGTRVALPDGYGGAVLRIAPISSLYQSISADSASALSSSTNNNANNGCALPKSDATAQSHSSDAPPAASASIGEKRARDWLVADDDDDGDIFAAKFKTEDRIRDHNNDQRNTAVPDSASHKPLSSSSGVSREEVEKNVAAAAAAQSSIATLPSVPTSDPLYVFPNTTFHTASELAAVAKRSIIAAPSSFAVKSREAEGEAQDSSPFTLRSVSNAAPDIATMKTFSSFMVWEHDHRPNAQDTGGVLTWIALSSILHAPVE